MRFPRGLLIPALGQEELEFAVMRIEALKLARQIALAFRGRQETEVWVCCCHALPLENAVWSRSLFANHWLSRQCRCSTELSKIF